MKRRFIYFSLIWLGCLLNFSSYAEHGKHTYQKVKNSVVKVLPTWPGYQRPGYGAPPGVAPEGSGFFISPTLMPDIGTHYVATAAHVINKAISVKIEHRDGTREEVELLGFDIKRDIAILKTNTEGVSVFVKDLARPEIGSHVCALGNPFGLGSSFSCGVVSGLNRKVGFQEIEEFIQTDVAINPGMSGGALVDEDGFLIGMINSIFTKEADINAGVNFVTPNDQLFDGIIASYPNFCSVEKVSKLLTKC